MSATTKQGPQGADLYARFAIAGALGCSVTHGAFTPVDVYVCRVVIHELERKINC